MAGAMPYLTIGCQAVIAVAFARSCAAKAAGRAAFADFRRWLSGALRVPAPLAGPAAAGAVAAEGAVAAALLFPPLVPAGFVAAAVLLAVFTAAVASMIRRRVRIPCRCFGAGRRPPGPPHIARNLALLAAAVTGLPTSVAGDGPPPFDAAAVLAAVAGAAAALLLIELEEIIDLVRPLPATGEEAP
ncbi:methylamine utilization protein MauE [Actinomadura sp. GC306]|uniref:MauE/DoxX family redox-associated membrane protein n=1 Tax=Actinomadura sp. GC306 TaxID=2530367 RepID=UPI001050B788|nr:MauE/DoxX family redox-associated membrane protein [Actinomadura sp. GC306]TDC62948.1 methylamine utilization protein MauE [Actinomadura sp. GC306]